MLVLTTCECSCAMQLCTEEIWQGTMEQIPKLGIQPAERSGRR